LSELKTKPTNASVDDFLAAIPDDQKRADCQHICKMMAEITAERPYMWGSAIVGFGSYHYIYASGHSGDAPITGFSPRKANIVLYIGDGFDHYDALMPNLGRFTTGKSCLYIKHLSDVDEAVLRNLVQRSVQRMRETYGTDDA
jgi:hypothetical protein